ncbi:hypothetical protein PFISCL1PPCAC_5658 [Pristionchus fissidentatus]|uniref:Uncharacterized protein n=1 Tax=Pristionchus fissidentatus TaxID=1538716 RepID=A0AAV5V6J8_9BILA|nr:hypothetical protein PFISCL1PPCAC_5658 [Pristionchus fissidentatus]
MATFDVRWKDDIVPMLISIGDSDEEIDMQSIRIQVGEREGPAAALVLLELVNRSVIGKHRRANFSHLYSHFPTQFTVAEAMESLKKNKTAFPSLFHIGSQSTVFVFLGDLSIPTESFSNSLSFVMSLLTLTKLRSPRNLSRFYNLVKVLVSIKGAKVQDSMHSLYSHLSASDS